MQRADLAARLIAAGEREREALIRDSTTLADVELAYVLKDICLDGWSSHPDRALAAAATLEILSRLNPLPEIDALRSWTSGIEALIHGQMERAIAELEDSHARFLKLDKPEIATAPQISKLIALAMLGRYDEAVQCGFRARGVALAHGDQLSAGKIEHNIGNIYFRRDQYRQAEKFQRAARVRFLLVGDQVQIAKVENSLALTLSQQHQIRAAEALYEQALARAEEVGLITTQAEIESSIGTLALYQGHYDRALDYLERSRRKYSELNRPHISAMTEQEIADAYLELNLAPEAAEIYGRVTNDFADLGMRAEEAQALAGHGRAAIILGDTQKAAGLLERARELYAAEGNDVGAAIVRLTEAQLLYAEQKYEAARLAASQTEPALAAAGTLRRLMFARWLHAESAREEGLVDNAADILQKCLKEAEAEEQREIAARCLTSLGLIAITRGQRKASENYFHQAINFIEDLRAPLPAEEFRTAFFSDKLVPYMQLAALHLANSDNRVVEALTYVERARSRGLVDALSASTTDGGKVSDSFEARLVDELDHLRAELNYYYNQINQRAGIGASNADEISQLHESIRERERKTLEISRQLQHRGKSGFGDTVDLDVERIQLALGRDSALIEYTVLNNRLVAFVITNERISVQKDLADELEVANSIAQFRFQIDALRYGSHAIRSHVELLTKRAQKHLQILYDRLVRPLEPLIGDRGLIIVPYRSLHYLPFHALHDRTNYLIEQRAVSYAPSAVVFQQCLAKPTRLFEAPLLFGVADEQTPLIHAEITRVSGVFPHARAFRDEQATVENLFRHCGEADLLHLACHAQFRPDNPLFSSLRLGDGWLTVRDAYRLKLNCSLVTLSACETGVNAVAPGEELIGMARGFLSAGSSSVLLSLWTVDDEATAQLMVEFYGQVPHTNSYSEALRAAQNKLLKEKPHPFFWSPFVLVGHP